MTNFQTDLYTAAAVAPTLSEWGMLVLVGLVVAYSAWTLRRRKLAA